MTVGLVIPTRQSAPFLAQLLPALAAQTLQPQILVVDSGSTDGSVAQWRAFGAQVLEIDPKTFNHGGTRRLAAENLACDDLIYMTQDAIPRDPEAFAHLVAALHVEPDIGVAYGRQLPHRGAGLLARQARAFNYPAQAVSKRLADAPRLGIKTCFSSDAFCAYRRDRLLEVGNFPADVIGTEDAHVAARMLLRGYAVRYAADAEVEHSHDYTVLEEFRRYFDIGVFYGRETWIAEQFGRAGGEGRRFVLAELAMLWRERQPWRIPEVVVRTGMKWAGYKLGGMERRLPRSFKQRIGMFGRYWQ